MKIRILILFALAVFLSSCATTRKVVYFQDVRNDTVQEQPVLQESSIRLQPDDKVSIVVASQEPMLNAMFNLPIIQPRIGASLTETAASQSQNEASVYTIDPEGNIDFPVLHA